MTTKDALLYYSHFFSFSFKLLRGDVVVYSVTLL